MIAVITPFLLVLTMFAAFRLADKLPYPQCSDMAGLAYILLWTVGWVLGVFVGVMCSLIDPTWLGLVVYYLFMLPLLGAILAGAYVRYLPAAGEPT